MRSGGSCGIWAAPPLPRIPGRATASPSLPPSRSKKIEDMRMTQAGEDSPRYFEDVAVGERTRTGSYTFERNSIVEFARLYDPQPMHLDEEAAKASFFGRLVASGWQTLGVTMRLMVEAKPLGTTPLIGLQ